MPKGLYPLFEDWTGLEIVRDLNAPDTADAGTDLGSHQDFLIGEMRRWVTPVDNVLAVLGAAICS